ncbi:unnamed protein product [Phytomonas sp. Hart1]|nr:unnamed protein product [Phytomonas sp. Hart1]|eukprot:CCW68111.1 unnamed protein product [Phytomonas sp. isolate Hart1]
MHRQRWRLAPNRDPFKVLGLNRSVSKAEVKVKYRELARVYHPDSETGNSKKMEEINQAYKLLMKEGGFERLHLPTNQSSDGQNRSPSEERRRRTVSTSAPYAAEQQAEGGSTSSTSTKSTTFHGAALSDEEMEKLSALDPTTERYTPSGKYLYQNRDDHTWVELDRPLYMSERPRYKSFTSDGNIFEEMRRRAIEKEKEQNEKTAFQRATDRVADSADLPTRNPRLLMLYVCVLFVAFYFTFQRTFARTKHQRNRTIFYDDLEAQRAQMGRVYEEYKDGLELSAATAGIIFLAASEGRMMADPVQPPVPEVYFHAVCPPKCHFNVVAGG